MRLAVSAFAIICALLVLPEVKASVVNGKIEDECKDLVYSIEKTVEYVSRYTMNDEYEAGAYYAELKFGELVRTYKELCE